MIPSDTCLALYIPPFPSLAFLKMLAVINRIDPMTHQRIAICRLKIFFSSSQSSHCFVQHSSFKGWCPPSAQHGSIPASSSNPLPCLPLYLVSCPSNDHSLWAPSSISLLPNLSVLERQNKRKYFPKYGKHIYPGANMTLGIASQYIYILLVISLFPTTFYS